MVSSVVQSRGWMCSRLVTMDSDWFKKYWILIGRWNCSPTIYLQIIRDIFSHVIQSSKPDTSRDQLVQYYCHVFSLYRRRDDSSRSSSRDSRSEGTTINFRFIQSHFRFFCFAAQNPISNFGAQFKFGKLFWKMRRNRK